MPSIATLSAKVREKDAEKSKILNDIKDLEGLKSQKIVGQVVFVVQSVGSVAGDYSIDLKVQPFEYNLSVTKLSNLTIGKEIELQLTSKNIVIEINCKKSDKEYSASFDLTEVPDNNSLSTQLDGITSSGDETVAVHVKATYDTVDGLIASKQIEMKQVEEELQKIADELKKATTQTSAKSSKKTKSSTQTKKKQPKQQQQQQVQQQEESADLDGLDDGGNGPDGDGSGGIIAQITNGAIIGFQGIITHRAVLLFGIAAFAIYTQGELASV